MSLSQIKTLLERLLARSGKSVECPCCGHHARRFFPAGVVDKRMHARCAFCGSLERHRLIAFMLKKYPLPTNTKVLSVAPEKPMADFLKNNFTAKITTLDLLRTDVDVQADLCDIPLETATFDVVIANHVLEHVPDDAKAMREIQRILKPGGRAILQTPIHWDVEKTTEDPNASPEECLRRFGQDDHVRLYGRDFVERLQGIGWQVELMPVKKQFTPTEIKKYGFETDEIFFKIDR